MKRIAIITGITSFLGKSTAKYLLSKGFIIFGILRPCSQNKSKLNDLEGLKLIEMDFDRLRNNDFECAFSSVNYKNCLSDLRKGKYEISFIHFGWGATTDRANFAKQMINVDYSMKVLEFAKLLKAKRFIFAGSQAEISGSPYGLAKKQFADMAVSSILNSNMSFIHLRIFSIFGHEDRDTSLIKSIVRCIKCNEDISLSSCNYLWNFLYIDDFCEIIYRLIVRDAVPATYDIASDDTRLLKNYCEAIKESFKSDIKLKYGDRPDSNEVFSLPDIRETIKIIGEFKFSKFEEAVLKV